MEILCRNPAGPEGPPGKGGNRPEASIGESSEMAASSVCSEHKSRVIEPRNIQIAGAFVFMPSLDMLQRKEVLLPLSLNASHSYRWLRKSFSDVLLREPSDIRVDHLWPQFGSLQRKVQMVSDFAEKSRVSLRFS